jgi:hypothetical protein
MLPTKRHESWTEIILPLGFGLDSDHKETSKTKGLKRLPQHQKRKQPHEPCNVLSLLHGCFKKTRVQK